MMSVMSELAPSLQRLVDARLDAIERHLIDARMPRNERQDIVSSVEDQIFELLGRTGKEEPSREDVLQVLCSIDPPEAYANVDRPAGRSATIPDDNMCQFQMLTLPRWLITNNPRCFRSLPALPVLDH